MWVCMCVHACVIVCMSASVGESVSHHVLLIILNRAHVRYSHEPWRFSEDGGRVGGRKGRRKVRKEEDEPNNNTIGLASKSAGFNGAE